MDVRAARCPFTGVPLPPAPDENTPRAFCAPAHSATAQRRRHHMVTSWDKAFTALWVADTAPQTDLFVDLIY